jgi:hypothetical protein
VPQVIAVKFNQVESVKEDVPVLAAIAQPVEHRHAIPITGDRLAVDQAGARLERERGARDQWEAAGPIVPVAGAIAAHEHSEAVVLDFVQPPRSSGRFVGWARQAGFAEVGEGYATQQSVGFNAPDDLSIAAAIKLNESFVAGLEAIRDSAKRQIEHDEVDGE